MKIKFLRAGQIGVAGPGCGEFLFLRGGLCFDGVFYWQEFFPVGPIAIFDTNSDRCADGLSMMDARENIGPIFLDFLAPTASITELPAVQLAIDYRDVDGQASRQAGDKRQQRLPVRFTSSVKTQH
jgi:hypothetical protein